MSQKEFYKKFYNKEQELNENDDDIAETVASLITGKKLKMLDVGCGSGKMSQLVHLCINQDRVIMTYGVDMSDSVKIANKFIEAKRADIEKQIPYPDKFFDAVISLGTIEHLFDYHKTLDEIYRVLKPGGEVVITTSNLSYWVNRLLVLAGKNTIDSAHEKSLGDNQHIRFFTTKSLTKLLESHGFKVEKCFTRYPQIPYLTRLSRKLGNPYINAGNFGYLIFVKARK